MRRTRSLQFDALEGRKLLTASHATAAHQAAKALTPLVISGTLSVDTKAMTQTENEDGSETTVLPVSGKLPGIGKVHGQWDETYDEYGDYEGPDTIGLTSAKGSFYIAFSNADPGKAIQSGPKSYYYQHPQLLMDGTGAYKHSTEGGTIDLNTNGSKNSIVSVTITSTS